MHDTRDLLSQRITELEAQNQMLEAFAGAVAENLKGLLYHIAGYSRTLRDVHVVLSDAELRECLDLLNNKALETLEIVDDLLFLSGVDLDLTAIGKHGQTPEPILEGTVLAQAIGGRTDNPRRDGLS